MTEIPSLVVSEPERLRFNKLGADLVIRLSQFFETEYALIPPIKCSGSTIRGTSLPEKLFGLDIDATVLADEKLLEKVAVRSNLFEGCQLFTIDFAARFSRWFQEVYFAGHRISGMFQGKQFDFSITDERKDRWKWDMNESALFAFSKNQIGEIRKLKYFLKLNSVYGSDVYGMVGPASELSVKFNDTFRAVIEKISGFSVIPADFSNMFSAIPFPRDYYGLFGVAQDPISGGLVKSFKYTIPHTFNRLVGYAGRSLNPHENLSAVYDFKFDGHEHGNFLFNLRTVNYCLAIYVFGTVLKHLETFELDVSQTRQSVFVRAKCSPAEADLLRALCYRIDYLASAGTINPSTLPLQIQEDLESKCAGSLGEYLFFVGMPHIQNLSTGTIRKIPVPFDILVREDGRKLIEVLRSAYK